MKISTLYSSRMTIGSRILLNFTSFGLFYIVAMLLQKGGLNTEILVPGFLFTVIGFSLFTMTTYSVSLDEEFVTTRFLWIKRSFKISTIDKVSFGFLGPLDCVMFYSKSLKRGFLVYRSMFTGSDDVIKHIVEEALKNPQSIVDKTVLNIAEIH